jgi:hypothetical protein
VPLVLIFVVLAVLGAWTCRYGIDGYLAGEILVRPKSRPAYMAYRDGAHAVQFISLVSLCGIGGALLALLGLAGLGLLAFGSPEQRAKILAASEAVRHRRTPTRFAWWIPVLVLVAFLGLLILLRSAA